MNQFHTALWAFLGVLSTIILPVPEELTLLGCGYLPRAGQLPLLLAFAAGYLGVFVGDVATFFGSRWVLPRALRTRAGEKLLSPRRRAWAEHLVQRRGAWTIVIARFLVGLRGPVYMALVASRFPRKRFLLVNSAVAVVEVGAMVLLGWLIGPSDRVFHGAREVEYGVAATLIFAVALPFVLKKWMSRERPA